MRTNRRIVREVLNRTERPRTTVTNYLDRLDANGLVQCRKIETGNCPFSGCRITITRVLHYLPSFISGAATATLVLKWNYFNDLCKEYPLVFSLLGMILSLIGITISYLNTNKDKCSKLNEKTR